MPLRRPSLSRSESSSIGFLFYVNSLCSLVFKILIILVLHYTMLIPGFKAVCWSQEEIFLPLENTVWLLVFTSL